MISWHNCYFSTNEQIVYFRFLAEVNWIYFTVFWACCCQELMYIVECYRWQKICRIMWTIIETSNGFYFVSILQRNNRKLIWNLPTWIRSCCCNQNLWRPVTHISHPSKQGSWRPTWGPPGSCRPQKGPMLAPWALLSGMYSARPLPEQTLILYCYTAIDAVIDYF